MISKELLLESIPSQLPPIIPLTTDASSWILHLPAFFKSPNPATFHQFFHSHPSEQHALKLYGKTVLENRYSQMFVTNRSVGSTYKYSGTSRSCIVCDSKQVEEQFILDLCDVSNIILSKLIQDNVVERPQDAAGSNDDHFYNCCLVNWYQPQHHIGLHADDERELNLKVPIVSLSWGGPRRFLLRPKAVIATTTQQTSTAISKVHEVILRDGDLLFMGGKCQEEFKHEIPKVRKMDGQVNERISWTIRSMNTHNNKEKKRKSNGDKKQSTITKRRR